MATDCLRQMLESYLDTDGEPLFNKFRITEMMEDIKKMKERSKSEVEYQKKLKEFVDKQEKFQVTFNKETLENAAKMIDTDEVIKSFSNPMEGIRAFFEKSLKSEFKARASISATIKDLYTRGVHLLETKLDGYWHLVKKENDADVADIMFNVDNKNFKPKNPALVKVAEAYQAANKHMIKILRASGIYVDEIANYITRQTHDPAKLSAQGFDTWKAEIYEKLDKTKTFKDSVDDLKYHEKFLAEAYKDIVENEPTHAIGKYSKSRKLHFKSGADWVAYNEKFGRHADIHSSIDAALHSAARHAAIVERMGTNPQNTLKKLISYLDKKDTNGIAEVHRMYNFAKGAALRAPTTKFGKRFRDVSTVITSAKLTRATVTAVGSDPITIANAIKTATGKSALAEWASTPVRFIGAMFSPAERKHVLRMLAVDTENFNRVLASKFQDHTTQLGDGIASTVSRWTFKANLLSAYTEVAKATVGLRIGTIFKDISGLVASNKMKFDELGIQMQRSLRDHGISEFDFKVIGNIKDDFISGEGVFDIPDETLTKLGLYPKMPTWKYKELLCRKVNVMINDYIEIGVPTPGDKEMRQLYRDLSPDSAAGMLARSLTALKTTSLKVFNDLQYTIDATGGGYMTAGSVMGMRIMLGLGTGYISWTMAEMAKEAWIDGYKAKDPTFDDQIGMLAKAGVGGLFGDYAFMMGKNSGFGVYKSIPGPIIGTGLDATKLGWEALEAMKDGKDKSNVGFKTMKLFIDNTPFLGLPYLYDVKKSVLQTSALVTGARYKERQ